MENINLYYDKELVELGQNTKYFAMPVIEKEMSFFSQETKLNIYQEIILELYKCGYNDIKTIEEVLNLDILEEEEEEDIEKLTHYIVKELKKMRYISEDNKITKDGLNILENNYKEEKELGNVFYNPITKEYENFIYLNAFYKIEGTGNKLFKEKIPFKNHDKVFINFGTMGQKKSREIFFLENNSIKVDIPEFTIENLIRIIDTEYNDIMNLIMTHDNYEEEFYSQDKLNFLKEKAKVINSLRKYKYHNKKESYILIALKDGEIRTSLNPDKRNAFLEIDLIKDVKFKEVLKESIENSLGATIQEKSETRIKFNENYQKIIDSSNGRLESIPSLVEKLLFFSQIENEIEVENKYQKIITVVYECFAEVFSYLLFNKYLKDNKVNDKNTLKLKHILEVEYKLSKELVNYFNLENTSPSKYIERSKKLRELIGCTCLFERNQKDKKIFSFFKKKPNFFEFIKKLINERNKFSHSGETQENIEELEFDFETEAKETMILFIQSVLDFKFKDIFNSTAINDEQIKKYNVQAEKELNLEFADCSTNEVFKELKNIIIDLKCYLDFKNSNYKCYLIKNIGILIEKNLNTLRKLLEKKIEIDDSLSKVEDITLKDIEDKFFKNSSCSENSMISKLFEINKNIPIKCKKIELTKRNFTKGTLNTCTSVLLYAKNNNKIKEILNKNIDFFKLAFVISSLRGHNGNFKLKENDKDKRELEAVQKLVKIFFETEKKLLKLLEEDQWIS
ncbi:MAG: hypothetical protein ACRC4T_03080 [Cetobacterium sp.]